MCMYANTYVVEEGLPKLFLKEEEEDSDFEIDPCALSSPAEMDGVFEEGDGQPRLADILAPLSGTLLPKEGLYTHMFISIDR